jgi:mRNA-degrading endonuclease RelE of RelBE toxin-antitoxin system
MDFSQYAIKYSKDALESRSAFPKDLLLTLDQIVNSLADNPNKYPERVIPASREGKSFVYMHPDPIIQVTYEVDTEKKIIYFFHFSAPALKVKKTIFVSYSHEDKEWLDKIRLYLSALEQEGLIQFWDDAQLEAGEDWQAQIGKVLESASASVLLVSQTFLSSKFIREVELPKLFELAEKEGRKIYWLPLSPSTVFDTHKDITKYQSLVPDPTKSLDELPDVQQKKVLVEVSKKISEAVTKH